MNDVEVSWTPDPAADLVDAEKVRTAIYAMSQKEIYCEHLALELARQLRTLIGRPVDVVVSQAQGHGVTAQASAP